VNRLDALILALCISTSTAVQAQDVWAPLAWFRVSEEIEVPPPPPCIVCEVLVQQLDQGCSIPDGNPYADTAYLRRSVVPPLSKDLQRDISIARLSGDATYAMEILASGLNSPDPEARYAAALTVATLSIQSLGYFDAVGERMLDVMQQAAEVGPLSVPASDYHYLRALHAQARGETSRVRTELNAAIDSEPNFFTAMVLSLNLALDKASALEGQGAALCQSSYDALMFDAARLLDLAPCRYHAAHLELFLKRQFQSPESVPALSAVQVYLSLIARRPDAAAAARREFSETDGPDCKTTVLADIDGLIDQYTSSTSESAE